VSPGKSACASVEKKNADSPKPERTSPVALERCARQPRRVRGASARTVRSGKLLAAAFSAPASPPFPPMPLFRVSLACWRPPANARHETARHERIHARRR
jgi:hypothetical protein